MLEFSSDNFSNISFSKRGGPSIVNEGHEVLMFHPEVFKPKDAFFGDGSRDRNGARGTVRRFHNQISCKSVWIRDCPNRGGKKLV